ncbi:MAG: hypothetical protein ACOYYJ_15210 [Chloroflexota bacterium]
MTTGLPKPPTIRSILLGIALLALVILAFLRMPDVVKYTGAALMFVPAKLGLIEMVEPQQVIRLSLAENPSSVMIPAPGRYALYTDNYDLLVVHDAVVAGHSTPWIKIHSQDLGGQVEVTLVERGLAWYDTPFARGRPVVLFEIEQGGVYQFTHPTRPDSAYIVPDVLTGKESGITLTVLAEIGLAGGLVFFIVNRRTRPRRLRQKEVQDQARQRTDVMKKKMQEKAEREKSGQKQARDTYEPENYWQKH